MASDIVFLKGEKLRMLSQLIRGQEVENLKNVNFKSVAEQVKYLMISNSNQETVVAILDKCGNEVTKYKNDPVRGPIAVLLLSYAETCLNNALQVVANFILRKPYLDEITTQVDDLIKELNELNTSDTANVAAFSNLIQNYNEILINYTKLTTDTRASKEFSKKLKDSGTGFQTLVLRYQESLGFGGEKFKDLKDEQKLQVYNAIIEASGRGKVQNHEVLLKANDKSEDITTKGVRIFLFNAAFITWDIYASAYTVGKAVRDAVKLATSAGATLGDIVTAAVATGLEGSEATIWFAAVMLIVVGTHGVFLVGETVGAIFYTFFGSGGQEPLPIEGYIFYAAEMPNGKDLAKKIA